MIKLSLLILTTENRKIWMDRMDFITKWQISQLSNPDEVEVIVVKDNGERTIGEKRNIAMDQAKGIAVSYIDEDDIICDGYVQRGIDFANSDKDVASLIGLYFANGIYDRPFRHSLIYKKWDTKPTLYERCPNHLNFVKKELVKDIKFEHKNFGEDGTASLLIRDKELLKTEYEINQCLYLYFARSK